MRALVTGATGFIGAHLTRRLLARGYQVRALAREGSRRDNLRGLDVEVATGDLRDAESLQKALSGCQVLFHVAAHYSLWEKEAPLMHAVNVVGTRNILTAALEKGLERVVHTSSTATIGLCKDGRPATEETPLDPRDLVGSYKRTKHQAEEEALALFRLGLPVVIVNPSTPIGALDRKPTPTGRIILDYLCGQMPAYVDTGLNLIAVEDVAEGHILALEKGRSGERYILGNENLALREIFACLEKITGIAAPRVRIPHWIALGAAYGDYLWSEKLRGREPRIPIIGVRLARKFMYFDAAKAVRELGLPQRSVEEALEKAVRWFREEGYVRRENG